MKRTASLMAFLRRAGGATGVGLALAAGLLLFLPQGPGMTLRGVAIAGLFVLGYLAFDRLVLRPLENRAGRRQAARLRSAAAADAARRASEGGGILYDAAKHHAEAAAEFGLPLEHAAHPGALFLGWLVRRHLTSPALEREAAADLARYRAGALSAVDLYLGRDGKLLSDLMAPEARAFARTYLPPQSGGYGDDLATQLGEGWPSEFHAPWTAETETRLHRLIDTRFATWQARGAPSA